MGFIETGPLERLKVRTQDGVRQIRPRRSFPISTLTVPHMLVRDLKHGQQGLGTRILRVGSKVVAQEPEATGVVDHHRLPFGKPLTKTLPRDPVSLCPIVVGIRRMRFALSQNPIG